MFWKKKKKTPVKKDLKYWMKEGRSITLIIFVVFAFRSSFFEPFRIPTGSMIPTIAIGDFILVNKFSYGFKLPYSDMFGAPIYLTEFESPNRGDVIVFKYPDTPSINYIKRVIGLPGDTIQMTNDIVYVNGVPFDRSPTGAKEFVEDMDDRFKRYDFNFFKVNINEVKDDPKEFVIQERNGKIHQQSWPVKVVPKDSYYVMGDNRHFSSDSRYWGFVPKENIKGKAMFVWFSWIIPFLDSDNAPKLRLHRIGTMIN